MDGARRGALVAHDVDHKDADRAGPHFGDAPGVDVDPLGGRLLLGVEGVADALRVSFGLIVSTLEETAAKRRRVGLRRVREPQSLRSGTWARKTAPADQVVRQHHRFQTAIAASRPLEALKMRQI